MVSKQKKQVHVTFSGRLPSAFHLDLLLKKNIDKFFHLDSLMLWPQKEPGKCKACGTRTDSNLVFGRPDDECSVVAIFLDVDGKWKISVTVLVLLPSDVPQHFPDLQKVIEHINVLQP